MSSAVRATESVKKQFTFPLERVQQKCGAKGAAFNWRSAQAKKAAAMSHKVNRSRKRTIKQNSMHGGKKTERPE